MADLSTLTAGLPADTSAKLQRLSARTGRDSSVLVGEAVALYVDRELAIVEAIERGRSEIRAGRGLGTDEVFQDVEAAISGIERGQIDR